MNQGAAKLMVARQKTGVEIFDKEEIQPDNSQIVPIIIGMPKDERGPSLRSGQTCNKRPTREQKLVLKNISH